MPPTHEWKTHRQRCGKGLGSILRIDKIQPYQLLEIKTTANSVQIKRSKLFEDMNQDEKDYLIKKFNKKTDFQLGDNHERQGT